MRVKQKMCCKRVAQGMHGCRFLNAGVFDGASHYPLNVRCANVMPPDPPAHQAETPLHSLLQDPVHAAPLLYNIVRAHSPIDIARTRAGLSTQSSTRRSNSKNEIDSTHASVSLYVWR